MRVFLLRHAETAWTLTGQHTGKTELELTPRGREQTLGLRGLFEQLLGGSAFDAIYVSPRKRARDTAELVFGDCAVTPSDLLAECDYGDYEGLTPAQIRERAPGWTVWNDGCPNGESASQVAARAAAFSELLRGHPANSVVCAVSHGHFLRFLTATLLGLAPNLGRIFAIEPGSVAELSDAKGAFQLSLWNRRG